MTGLRGFREYRYWTSHAEETHMSKPFDPAELTAAVAAAARGDYIAAAQHLDYSEALAAALYIVPRKQPVILATSTRGAEATPEALAAEIQAEQSTRDVAVAGGAGVAAVGPMSLAVAELVIRLALSLLKKRMGL